MPFLTLDEQSFPYLRFPDLGGILPWSHGKLYAMRLASTSVRASPRGVHFSSSDLPGTCSGTWQSLPCMPTQEALCETRDASRMLVFPNRVVDVPDDWSQIIPNAYTSHFDKDSACVTRTGRSISPGDVRYELSLCDLIDSNLDIITSAEGHMMWRQDDTLTVEVVLIALFALYCVSCVTDNIARLIRRESTDTPVTKLQAFLVAIVWVYMVVRTITMRCLVPGNQIYLANLLLGFVFLEALFVYFKEKNSKPRSRSQGVSVITALLFLVTFRIYHSFDTPYTILLSTLFAARSSYKLLSYGKHCCESEATARAILLLIDGLVLTAILDVAVFPSSLDPINGAVAQASVLFLGFLFGLVSRVATAPISEELERDSAFGSAPRQP